MEGKNSTTGGANFLSKSLLMFGIVFADLFIFLGLMLFPFSVDFKNIHTTNAATQINYETINTNTVWTLAGSPYTISADYLLIANNATLTIEPGVIIKLRGNNIIVYGTLIAQGETDKPIIFTSTNDDSAGGKTVPWSTGNPLAGDWGSIEVRDGIAHLDNVKMSYGGSVCVYLIKARPIKLQVAYADFCYDAGAISGSGAITMSNSEIYNNNIGLELSGEGITISNSKIYNNKNGGLISWGTNQISAINNWWGDDSGPYHSSLNPQGKGDKITGNVLFDPWTGKAAARNPVIIVPGIMGSYLVEASTGNQVWLNLVGYTLSGEDGDLRKLEMFPLGGSVESLVVDNAIEKVLTEDFYSGLIQELKNNGYKEGTDLFVFPYDWRYSIDCLAGAAECPDQGVGNLDTAIGRVLTSTGSKKVDIIAHSMGGLIAKAYIKKFGSSTIDKLITIATPNLGSPRASKGLLYGDNMDIGAFGVYILNEATMKEISQNIPSIYQLLPSQEYLNLSGSYIADIYDADNNGVKGNLNYTDTSNFLINTGRNGYLLANATALHNKIDNLQVKDSFSISGCRKPTIDKIFILNKERSGGYEYALRYTSGDGTVPLISADNFGSQKYYAYQADHGKISSSNGVRQLVGAILDNKQANFNFSQYQNVSSSPADCALSGTQISYHSPVTLSAYDQYGNYVGKNGNGDTEINIPGAQYDEIDGNKFIFLPSGENYTIIGRATASGSFNARVETVEDGQYTNESYFNEVPLAGISTKVEMAISDNQSSYAINIDQNGDGSVVEEKNPDSVLTDEQINDLTAPQTIVSISGQAGNNGYYISAVKINFTATDDNSGVLKTEYSLDNGTTWIKCGGEFTISQDGTVTILYSSTDRAGNREENKQASFAIDQTKPIISILLPQEGQEILNNDKLDVEYFANDNFSDIAPDPAKIYLDGQLINSNIVDLFGKNLGPHQIKITIQDLAGNQAEQIINFFIVTDVDGTIADINRAYDEKMITKIEAKKDLINDLTQIKTFQKKYGQRIDKEKTMRDKVMIQCLKHKNQAWCETKIGKILDKIEYQLSKINQAIIKLKYNLVLEKLDRFLKKNWINQAGYNIIKDDIKYLISKS
ncbi:MAG: hypothetical protein PHE24_03405 [Patescibacteria group bacterium]|nr:hypothetical protein [Patescibacteria group bacterium]